jgi:hypothetical protein
LSGTNALLGATFSHLPDSISGVDKYAGVFLTATNCYVRVDEVLADGQRISRILDPGELLQVMKSSRSDVQCWQVTLKISTNVTFGAVHELVKEFSQLGIKSVFYLQTSQMSDAAIPVQTD